MLRKPVGIKTERPIGCANRPPSSPELEKSVRNLDNHSGSKQDLRNRADYAYSTWVTLVEDELAAVFDLSRTEHPQFFGRERPTFSPGIILMSSTRAASRPEAKH